jgi:cysteine synthase B
MPCTLSFSAQMVPAPMKPMPATMPAAIRAESKLNPMETTVNRQAPSETSMCVRNPAGLWCISRSMPTIAPKATANTKFSTVSGVKAVGIISNIATVAIKIHCKPAKQAPKTENDLPVRSHSLLRCHMIANSILDLIGNTPMVKISHLNTNPNLEIYVKLEKFNIGGSVKDRIAKYMIEQAEKSGQLTKDKIVIEPTSGNTGIGLALVCRVKGYNLFLVMPENMTLERRQILNAMGAKIILSEAYKGMDGAEDLARKIANQSPDKYFMPNQFANEANVRAHYETTAQEIWQDTKGKVTHFFAGIGTTGTLMGVSKRLKEYNPNIQIIAVEPSKGTTIPGLKNLEAQYVPEIWNKKFVDEIHQVHPSQAEEAARLLALQEGIFVGPSSGAIFHIALQKAEETSNGVMVAIAPDGGEKYLSTTLCDPKLCLKCARKYGIRCAYIDGRPITKTPNK